MEYDKNKIPKGIKDREIFREVFDEEYDADAHEAMYPRY